MTELFRKSGTNLIFEMPPAARIRFETIIGNTLATGSGDKSPDNPYALSGVTKIIRKIPAGTGFQIDNYSLPKTLYGLSDSVRDDYSFLDGQGTQRTEMVVWAGTESWYKAAIDNTNLVGFGITLATSGNKNVVCDRLKTTTTAFTSAEEIYVNTASQVFVRVLKSRLTGWDDAWTDAQKVAAFKTWLASNPLSVVYGLAIPAAISGMTIEPFSLSSNEARIIADGGGEISLSVFNDWTVPKTTWATTDPIRLDPDYARIKGNIGYIKKFSEKMYADFPMIEMGEFTIDGFPFDTFFNNVVDNVTRLEENLFKPPADQSMIRYAGGQRGWNADELNIIEGNVLRLHDAMLGQWNCLKNMPAAFGLGTDEF